MPLTDLVKVGAGKRVATDIDPAIDPATDLCTSSEPITGGSSRPRTPYAWTPGKASTVRVSPALVSVMPSMVDAYPVLGQPNTMQTLPAAPSAATW